MLFLIILIASVVAYFIGPWWMIAIIAFVAAFFWGKRPSGAFAAGLFAAALAWGVTALFRSIPNHHMLAGKVAGMLALPYWYLLLLIVMLIAGLVGGLAALTGRYFRQAFFK